MTKRANEQKVRDWLEQQVTASEPLDFNQNSPGQKGYHRRPEDPEKDIEKDRRSCDGSPFDLRDAAGAEHGQSDRSPDAVSEEIPTTHLSSPLPLVLDEGLPVQVL